MWVKGVPLGQTQMHQYGIFFQQHGTYENEPCAPGMSNSDAQLRIWMGSEVWYTDVPTPGGMDWYLGEPYDLEWHHLVVTYDEEYGGDPCSMRAQLYLDGYEVASSISTDPDAKLGPELSHVVVGAQNDMGWTYNYFAGYIDEFAIYEGILDPNRVLVHYVAWPPKNCADVWARGLGRTADINMDCMINFADIASFALSWRACNDPCDPDCVPPEW